MPHLPFDHHMQIYTDTNAEGEMVVTAVFDDDFWAAAVAPHQVYRPRDNLLLSSILEAAVAGKLCIFSKGDNHICFTHLDNYCYGLIVAERKLYNGSLIFGKFFIVADESMHPELGACCMSWKELDKAIVRINFIRFKKSINHCSFWLVFLYALIAEVLDRLMHPIFKLIFLSGFFLTMNLWFRIDAAAKDFECQPIITFFEESKDTIAWFKDDWLPKFSKERAAAIEGLSQDSPQKIDIQAEIK